MTAPPLPAGGLPDAWLPEPQGATTVAAKAFDAAGLTASPDALEHLHAGLAERRPWADVLLESIGLWRMPSETYKRRAYTYLLQGEAFDWLLLAERLVRDVRGAIPVEEQERLLFKGELPVHVSAARFKEALGTAKYRAHLNFFYGVVVEEALMLAVEHEVLKQRGVRGLQHYGGVDDTVMERLYGDTQEVLLRRFQQNDGRHAQSKVTMSEWKAFTYWLFKLRLGRSDQARVASDVRKGLRKLHELRGTAALDRENVALPLPALMAPAALPVQRL